MKVIQWEKENPFGVSLDGDDPEHLTWVYGKAQDRANQFHITGLSYRLVQGVLKNIIPAVASTNAVIASVCATEVRLHSISNFESNFCSTFPQVFKIATSCYESLNNYMVFNDVEGIYTYSFESERKPDCLACSNVARPVLIDDPNTMTLEDLIALLCDSADFQMKNPGKPVILS